MDNFYETLKNKNKINRQHQIEQPTEAKFLPNLPEPLKKPKKPRKEADPFSINYEAEKTRLEQAKPIKGKNMHKFKTGYKETLDKLYQDVFSIVVSQELLHEDNTFATIQFVQKLNEMRTDRMKVKYDLPTVVLFTEMEGGKKLVCWFVHDKVIHAHFENFAVVYGFYKKRRTTDKFMFWKYKLLENMCVCG
jgi:hypothetical protein